MLPPLEWSSRCATSAAAICSASVDERRIDAPLIKLGLEKNSAMRKARPGGCRPFRGDLGRDVD